MVTGLFREETDWYNEMLLSVVLPGDWWRGLPHLVQSWLRNCIGVYLMYFIIGFLWCFVIYYWKQHAYIPKESIPTVQAMKKQILVASMSMPFYSVLPTVYEYMIESGWTWCFFHISDVGWPMYLVYLALYLIFVECGMYWMHRELHHIKPLYKHLHAIHHVYNKENTLSPFAGLASHPVDGVLLAMPHVVAPFLLPTHFRTNITLLFMEAMWTANIHDCIDGKVWPVCWLSHCSPYNLPAQLWPLHYLDGLAVWHTSKARRYPQAGLSCSTIWILFYPSSVVRCSRV